MGKEVDCNFNPLSEETLKSFDLSDCISYIDSCDALKRKIESETDRVEKYKAALVEKSNEKAKSDSEENKKHEIKREIKAAAQKGFQFFEELLKKDPYIMENVVTESAKDPANVKLGKHQKNTGVYLWAMDYEVEKFLGAGANGVVWLCKNGGKELVVKVTCNPRIGPFRIDAVKSEKNVLEKLKSLLSKESYDIDISDKNSDKEKIVIKSPKNYLLTYEELESKDSSKGLFESQYSEEGDLTRYVKSDEFSSTSSNKLDEIISMIKQGAKGLCLLHKAGYSHNDVKPDNLMIIERESKKFNSNENSEVLQRSKSNEMTETPKKDSGNSNENVTNTDLTATKKTDENGSEAPKSNGLKKALKVADFGAMTEIKNTRKIFVNKHFCAPDCYKLSAEAVAKRDVYSLGLCALFLLFKGKKQSYHKLADKLVKNGVEKFISSNDVLSTYCGSDKETETKLESFLSIIQKMVQSSHKNRISIETTLAELKELKK